MEEGSGIPARAGRTGKNEGSRKLRTSGKGRGWRKGMRLAFDGRQMAAFVAAIESGAMVQAAAKKAGVTISTLYERRRSDPAFAAAWAEAVNRSAGPVLVMGRCGRRYQKQRARRVRFDRERKQIFLDRFAGSCNLATAAEAAGVSVDSVYSHLRSDPAFAEGFQAALEIGYRLLEAETLRQQRAAQEAYRINPKADEAFARSFERSMQLLREYKRRDGSIGRRAPKRIRERWTFDEAIEALEKKLKHFGVEIAEAGASITEAETPHPGPLPPGEGDFSGEGDRADA